MTLKIAICEYLILAKFGFLGLILHQKYEENTFSNYLGAIRTMEQKMGPFGYFRNRATEPTQGPK